MTPPPRAGAPSAAAPTGGGGAGASPAGAAAKKKGNKSECVQRVEEMQRMREERRRRAEEKKSKRAQEALEAEDRGGIEAVDFLNQIKEYQARHGIPEQGVAWTGGDVWQDDSGSSIRVCVRKRPMLRAEHLHHDFDVVRGEPSATSLVVLEPKTRVDLTKQIEAHRFTFDAVFNENDGNESIYAATLHPLLEHVFAGGHATVFAFGQTGSGKTCTMAGHGNHEASDGNASGLYKLAAHDTVGYAARHGGVDIGVSFFEVYRGVVLDLLSSRTRLEVLEDGKGRVQVVGLREVQIFRADELLELVRQAEELRAVGSTSANEQSSRSHAILQVVLRERATGRQVGKLSLVDLAGSERAADANDKDRQTRIEGAEINKSLLCLKECIRSLDSNNGHVPFRGSKLTQVLRDSFVGRAKTVMIATVSPGSSAAENTLNTLRYAQRVKEFSAKRPPAAGGANRRASGAVPPAHHAQAPQGRAMTPPTLPSYNGPDAPVVELPGAPPRTGGTPPRAGGTSPRGGGTPPPAAGGGAAGGAAQLFGTRRFSDGFDDDVAAAANGAVPRAVPAAVPAAVPTAVPTAVAAPPLAPLAVAGAAGGGHGKASPPPEDEDEEGEKPSARARAEDAAIEDLSASIKKDSPGLGGGGGAAAGPNAEEVGQFFKSVAAVSRAEEALVAQHKEAVEAEELLLQQERRMLDDLKDADGCSVDEYASALEVVLAAKLRICSELQTRLSTLKEQMANEEALSARVKQVPLY